MKDKRRDGVFVLLVRDPSEKCRIRITTVLVIVLGAYDEASGKTVRHLKLFSVVRSN